MVTASWLSKIGSSSKPCCGYKSLFPTPAKTRVVIASGLVNDGHKKTGNNSRFFVVVPHIGELSNQYKEELQLLFKIKPLLSGIKL